jgi:Zinc-binding
MSKCTVCQLELKITKTNTELLAHATSKHGSTLSVCFPGATDVAAELMTNNKKGVSTGDSGGLGKKQEKAKNDGSNLDDLLSAGLSAGKKKGKK